MAGEKDRVAGGLGELLDTRRDVDGVADQGELEFACAADGSGDHWTGVDPDADPKVAVRSLGDQAANESSGTYRRIGVIGATRSVLSARSRTGRRDGENATPTVSGTP